MLVVLDALGWSSSGLAVFWLVSWVCFAEDTWLFHCLGSERFVAGTTYR
jgi:hypothetical protein